MKILIWLSAVLFCAFMSNAQPSDTLAVAVEQIHQIIIQADNSDTSITASEFNTLEHLYNQSIKRQYQLGKEICGIALLRYNMRQGHYQKAIEFGRQVTSGHQNFINSTTATEAHRMMGLCYSNLGLYNKAMEEYRQSLDAINLVKTIDFQHYLRAISYENLTSYFEQTNQHLDSIEYYYKLSIREAEMISDTNSRMPSNYKFNAILYGHRDLADYYLNIRKPSDPKKAEKEIEIALKLYEQGAGKVMIANKLTFLATIAQSFCSQRIFDKAIQFGQQGLSLEVSAPSPYDRVSIYETLAKSYLATNSKEASAQYMNLYTALKDSLQYSEKRQTSATVKQLLASENKAHSKKTSILIQWAVSSILAVLFLAFIFWKIKSSMLRKKYESQMAQLREEHALSAANGSASSGLPLGRAEKTITITDKGADGNTKPGTGAGAGSGTAITVSTGPDSALPPITEFSEENTPTNESSLLKGVDEDPDADANLEQRVIINGSGTIISDQTEAKLLARLEKFERTHRYLRRDINLAYLAHYLGTNQTYVTELLKTHRGTTYVSYVNQLKIDYIKKKLYEDPLYREYKITHLAEVCGFASRQVFITVFKKHTGMPPSYFIAQLKQEKI
ncbi:Helix-turn-helix domain-containing protein [Arachidicoccus rhizosphaerae]|uniref:Helix-turn-helix domain-containing protein n=1 Tax=Arachidicoccus rhizosphaerae TaxID=551991 RepID=A0A1H4ACE5_9BACT|nr:helix-turn-helix transcriptional regulator [Arachidicoccus rhizosphaerae]SEA33438.1 Helix-turn-helix domain-containing protein [Arachidicoccus rhizosphaerae]